jgi:hypothetical protein
MEVNFGNIFEHLGNTTMLYFPPLQREREREREHSKCARRAFATSPLPRKFATDLFQIFEGWSIVVE